MTAAATSPLTAGTWNLDASHSEVGFSVRHAGISKVRGSFTEFDATLTIGESLADSSVEATVQIASVSTKDANRDAHLKSADFFDAEQFPTMTFKSTGTKGDADEFVLIGDLTIRGVTKQVELETELGGQAVDAFGATRVGFSASTTISRKEFGITWNAALEAGGVLVSDKVKIEIDASFVLPTAE
ncbi:MULTISPECIES: YceI family protein [Micrococcaceae]|uniref:YceI family protein n=1 Tax=Micrococcaceae TaxID=1268 RepID=UPI00063DA902|nr:MULTISPECIES: YceI family protein [unclassified Arthrobacter]ALQ29727.1 polyisoprenoid-binding protein [Arthrobacter sp. YC-RL1]KLI88916.1 polyisoprenoid-binding protein [Arthrobacter sp. YC-RL1]RKS18012.1 polyisoprenoid-binding protein YceI [Arthrobacter sp. AG1021]